MTSVSKRLSHLEKEHIMLRSMAVLLALMILPGFASAQEQPVVPQGTHEVVKGETLWALAERYLGDPFRWPLIFEANRDRIEDPHWIYPHQMFVIPGLEGEPTRIRDVAVVTRGQEPTEGRPAVEGDLPPCPGPSGRTVFYEEGQGDRGCRMEIPDREARTAFYSDPSEATAGVTGATRYRLHAVPRSLVYSTPWLEKLEEEIPSVGRVASLAAVDPDRTPRDRATVFEKLHIDLQDGVTLGVGDLLQSFSVGRSHEELGRVVRPTGILVVTSVEEAGVVASISAEFDRVQVGQAVRRVPAFDLEAGVEAVGVESDLTADILGFNLDGPLQGFGSVAFLDVGEAEGIRMGDEFLAYVNRGDGWSGQEAARLQVVLVNGGTSSARVVEVAEPVLGTGTRVHLVRKMQ